MVWLFAAGFAAPEEQAPANELIVYGDPFARWDDTRWVVSTELLLPLGTVLGADANLSVRTFALQQRAIVHCDKDARLGGKKWEIGCAIEDVALTITTQDHWHERDQPYVQKMLDELDAKLTGAVVQLQVDRNGGVTNVDLEGLTADNDRERRLLENLRLLASRQIAGFHLRIPDQAQREGRWLETKSTLFDIPSVYGARGSSELVHTVSTIQSSQGPLQLVQSLGEGTTAFLLPNTREVKGFTKVRAGAQDSTLIISAQSKPGMTGPVAYGDSPELGHKREPTSGSAGAFDIEGTYSLEATGVAVFERASGILTERVWVVVGWPTASSMGGTTSPPYVYRGALRKLAPTERPDLGPTRQVAWPTQQMPGLNPWVPLELP